MGYGTNYGDTFCQLGVYAGLILNGTKRADLPVLRPSKFELVINLKTAKTLRLKISESFLLLTDEVIE
jgi:putative ABC transport system substrate-binding protein